MSDREIVEAALFAAGSAVEIQKLQKILNKDKKQVTKIVETLIRDYEKRESGLEVVDLGERYVMQVRSKYSDIIRPFAPRELNSPMLRTLSMIAYHQPVVQSDIVDMRGNKAYDHIRELQDRGFIESTPHGRTKLLSTTPLFADYFGLEKNKPELIRNKMIELSKQQSGKEGLDRWLGRRFVGFTPMYESLAQMCGIKDYRMVDAYNPTEDELQTLDTVYKMVISRGYKEEVEKHYSGEIIEAGSTTFDDLAEAVNILKSEGDPARVKETLELLEELKNEYRSRAMTISARVTPQTEMVARIVKDLHIGVSKDGILIAPDYETNTSGEEIGRKADILVPSHRNLEGGLIERVKSKYDAVIKGLRKAEEGKAI